MFWLLLLPVKLAFCLVFGVLFLPFLILRMVLRVAFGLVLLPFVLLIVVGALFFALFGVVAALFMPLMPFILIALAIWAITRHSRAATVYPN